MCMQRNREELSAINFQAARETLVQTLNAEGFNPDAFTPAFALLDDLQHLALPGVPLPNWRAQLPKSSSWWLLVDRYFARAPLLTTGLVTTTQPVATPARTEYTNSNFPVSSAP